MKRTSFMLPDDLRRRAESAAKKLNISVGEFYRQAINAKAEQAGEAPDFFDFDWVYTGPAPRDGSVRPEKYTTRDPHGRRKRR